jgi:hypothetical protein
MSDNQTKPLQAVLHGMDGRTYKTMVMYFQGPCKGAAVVVEDTDAEVDIVDADFAIGKEALDKIKEKSDLRPVIVLSREEIKLENIIYVEKPIRLAAMLEAFEQARLVIEKKGLIKPVPASSATAIESATTTKTETSLETKKRLSDSDESKKTAKHKTAMQLDEGSFSTFIGIIPGIDFNDQEQVIKASYSPKNYFQGYVVSAIKVAKEKHRMLQLNSTWKPLLIFPHSHEIWLDADDKQLRAFASLEMNKATGSKLTITAVNPTTAGVGGKLDRFHDADAFVWKLAVWTSKGRYPHAIDIHRPVFIKQWPNFTRFLITPHALRITALLINGPRTMLNLSEVLEVKPQYVFVFISAAYALGLVGQAQRKSDELFAPPPVETVKKESSPSSKGLLSKILGKLRSS